MEIVFRAPDDDCVTSFVMTLSVVIVCHCEKI